LVRPISYSDADVIRINLITQFREWGAHGWGSVRLTGKMRRLYCVRLEMGSGFDDGQPYIEHPYQG
jgi:hypothetical protein